MINRQLIRTKIVQLVYAYYQNGPRSIDQIVKELHASLHKAYELYALLLDLIIAITREERRRLAINQQRALREGIYQPVAYFADNCFAAQLEDNQQLEKLRNEFHLDWTDDTEFVRELCDRIENTEVYREYLALEAPSYNDDREFWRRLYKQVIQGNEDLDRLLEEKSLYWNDDKDIVDTFVIKTIKRFQPENGTEQELLPQFKDEEDVLFAEQLLKQSIANADQYQQYMNQASRNWDISRFAYMDLVIMQIALAEMLTFPEIPVSVTINEYVDLAKVYSTPKSSSYINGMLDTIARELASQGILLKPLSTRK